MGKHPGHNSHQRVKYLEINLTKEPKEGARALAAKLYHLSSVSRTQPEYRENQLSQEYLQTYTHTHTVVVTHPSTHIHIPKKLVK